MSKKNRIAQFAKNNSKKFETLSADQLKGIIDDREKRTNRFPIEVFNDQLKPFIQEIIDPKNLDFEPSFVGLALLNVYSTVIGNTYKVDTGQGGMFMSMWGAMNGMSSSGKSQVYNIVHAPIFKIQEELARERQDRIALMPTDKQGNKKDWLVPLRKLWFRDARIETLLKDILADNPKGVCKYSDELLEWIKGMNSGSNKQVGPEEEIYLSAWDCSPYDKQLSGKKTYYIRRPFINVTGGVQPSKLKELFSKDRDTTGFIFRVLFANQEIMRMPNINLRFSINKEFAAVHEKAVRSLHENLFVEDQFDDPAIIYISDPALDLMQEFCNKKQQEANSCLDSLEKNIKSGIFGKIRSYAYRISGILHMMDKALENTSSNFSSVFGGYSKEEMITTETMERALRLCEYFYNSAYECYQMKADASFAPAEVLRMSSMLKNGWPWKKIAMDFEEEDTPAAIQRVRRDMENMAKLFPKLFGGD